MPTPPELRVTFDAIEEALLVTQAAERGLTVEEYCRQLVAAGLQQAAQDAVEVDPVGGAPLANDGGLNS